MNVPRIIERGAEWFAGIGTAESKGTKVFSVSGDVARPGVYELELGSLSLSWSWTRRVPQARGWCR